MLKFKKYYNFIFNCFLGLILIYVGYLLTTTFQGYFVWKNQVNDYVESNRLYQERLLELQSLKEKAVKAGFTPIDVLEVRNIIIEHLQNSDILIMEDHWDETSLNSKLSLLGDGEEMAGFFKWLSQKISPAMVVKQLEITSTQEGVGLDLIYVLKDRTWLLKPGELETAGDELLSFVWNYLHRDIPSENFSYQSQIYDNGGEVDYSRGEIDPKIYKKPDYITWLGYYHSSTKPHFLLEVYGEALLFTPDVKKTSGDSEYRLLLLSEPVLQIGDRLYKIKE